MKTVENSTSGTETAVSFPNSPETPVQDSNRGDDRPPIERLAGQLGTPFGRPSSASTDSLETRNPNVKLMRNGSMPKSTIPEDLISERFMYVCRTGHDPVPDRPGSRSEIAWRVCLHLANQYWAVFGSTLHPETVAKIIATFIRREDLSVSEHYYHRSNGRYRPDDAVRLSLRDATKAVRYVADNPPITSREAAREDIAVNGVMSMAYLRSRLDTRDITTVDVWRFMMNRAREEGSLTFGASLREIGDVIGRSAASVMRATHRLVEIGLVAFRDNPAPMAERTIWTLDPDCWEGRHIPDRFLPDDHHMQESMSSSISSDDAFAPTGLGRLAGDVMATIWVNKSGIRPDVLKNRLHYPGHDIDRALAMLESSDLIRPMRYANDEIFYPPADRDHLELALATTAEMNESAGYLEDLRIIHQLEREWFHGEFRVRMSKACRLRYAIFLTIEAIEQDPANDTVSVDRSGDIQCVDTSTGDTVTLTDMWRRAGYRSYADSIDGMDARFPAGSMTDDIIDAFTM